VVGPPTLTRLAPQINSAAVEAGAERIGLRTGGQGAPMADVVSIVKARSMLLILQATCEQTLRALEAAENELDSTLAEDLRNMIARTEAELANLAEKLETERSAQG
jgi:hypothetical protein